MSHDHENGLLLPLPEPDLPQLSLTGDNRLASLQQWLNGLSLLKVGDSARQFLTLLPELLRLQVPDSVRLDMTELLRPAVHTVLAGLERHYQQQGIQPDERARQIAGMADYLRTQLAILYYAAALRMLPDPQQKRDLFGSLRNLMLRPVGRPAPASQLGLALYRSIDELSLLYLQALLRYRQPQAGMWLRLHEMYLIAEQNKLTELVISTDSETGQGPANLSIRQLYQRPCLLALCNPNQLRPNEILEYWRAGTSWSNALILTDPMHAAARFSIDLNRDLPPQLVPADAGTPDRRGIDLNTLNTLLSVQTPLPAGVSASLRDRLRQSISGAAQRHFPRQTQSGSLQAALGLGAVHFHLSGGKPFEQTTEQRPGRTPTLSPLSSKADFSFDYDPDRERQRQQAMTEQARPVMVAVRDVSPSGYRLHWQQPPALLRSGELIVLSTTADGPWQTGVIRWMRQIDPQDGGGVDTGIELLSPNCRPCGIRLMSKTGDTSEYYRALLLPAHQSLEQAATLITLTTRFQPGQRVMLRMKSHEVMAELSSVLYTTASFRQFAFALTQAPLRQTVGEAPREAFNDLWQTL